jgi:hypothetical protein
MTESEENMIISTGNISSTSKIKMAIRYYEWPSFLVIV